MIWEYPSQSKVIYLTFDDGPTPEITDWVLDILNKYNAKATFFCIGKNIEVNPEIFKRILNEEHSIGNHTYNHLKGWKTKTKTYLHNIEITEKIFNSFNFKTSLFRPPYGQIKSKQAKQLLKRGYKIIMWRILSIDWNNKISEEKCLNNVIKNTTSGDIVVFHDSIKASKNLRYALPKVLGYFSEKGYTFKRIPE